MFAVERQRVIRRYIEEHQQADVHELSILLNISEVTVRRDLERLETSGYIERTHGGAVIREHTESRSGEEAASRDELGIEIVETAIRLVSDGDTLLISSGELPRALSRALAIRTGCTVLTNDILVAQILTTQAQHRCVFLGGDLSAADMACYGGPMLDELSHFHVRRFFCEVDGFGEHFSLSVQTREKALFIQRGREQAEAFTILCPGQRLRTPAFYHLGEMKSGDSLITDRTIGAELKKAFFLSNIRVHIAQELVPEGLAQ